MMISSNLQLNLAAQVNKAWRRNDPHPGQYLRTEARGGISVQEGFTLLELLISITLMSIIIVILSLALRTGIGAYTRAKGGNEQLVAATAIEGLLSMQLRAIVDGSQPGLKDFSLFEGSEDGLTMVTTHVPIGAGAGGIFLVTYRFDPDKGQLIYGQRIITTKDDLKARLPEDITEESRPALIEEGWDISIIPWLKSVTFSYEDQARDTEPDTWPRQWERHGKPPRAIALTLIFENGDSGRIMTSRHIFHVSVS